MGPLKELLRLPASLSSLLILLSATVRPAAAELPPLTDDASCGCYLTSGNESHFFTNHRFFDFRSLPEYAGVPPVIQDANASAQAGETSAFFTSSEWTDFWMLGRWNNSNGAGGDATVLMVNSPNNVYIEANSEPDSPPRTWLTLRTQRLAGFQTAAEIESVSASFKYLSLRMRARTVGAPGAITAMFTYRDASVLADVQEADLEVRTSDPRTVVHYTNQPAYTADGGVVAGATRNATLPGGRAWSDWAVHRVDWAPGRTTWYVDGEPAAQIAFQAPRDESNVVLNAWSDGSAWAGNMSLHDAAYLQVQWLEILFNNSEASARAGGEGEEPACASVCSIDRTPRLGTPAMLWENGAAGRPNGAGGPAAWFPTGMMVLLMALSTGLLG